MDNDLNTVESHQKEFDRLYSRLKRGDVSIGFPLGEIEKFHWERGPYGDRVYSYFYRRFTGLTIGLLQVEDFLRILNIGCGLGFEEKNLAHLYRNLEIWSIDISVEMALRAVENGCPSSLCLSLAEALPFPDESFDRILVREVIEHVLSPRSMMKEIGRCLKPGGLAVITTEFESSLALTHLFSKFFFKRLANLTGYCPAETPYKNKPPTLKEMEEMAKSYGLILERVVWDGALYQFCASRLFQNVFRSRIDFIAHFFSRLESFGAIDRYFCDQVKLTLRKPGSCVGEKSTPPPIVYCCPECHGRINDSLFGKQCLSCGKIYPYADRVIPNFILYDFSGAGKALDHIQQVEENRCSDRELLGKIKEYIFRFSEFALRSLYLLAVLVVASLFVLCKSISKKPGLQDILRLDKKLANYLRVPETG